MALPTPYHTPSSESFLDGDFRAPSALHTCRESRQELLRYYKLHILDQPDRDTQLLYLGPLDECELLEREKAFYSIFPKTQDPKHSPDGKSLRISAGSAFKTSGIFK